MRICKECKKEKEEESFSPSHYCMPEHYNITCKKCYNKRERAKRRAKRKAYEGVIYIVTNPAWEGWVKIGGTKQKNPNNRLQTYNTSSPFRDYYFEIVTEVDDVYTSEEEAMEYLDYRGIERRNEWFKTDIKTAKDLIKRGLFKYMMENNLN